MGSFLGGVPWLLLFGGVGALAGANLQRIFHWFHGAFDRLAKAYGRLLERAIHFRRILVSVLLGGVVLTGLAFVAIPSGFVPTEDQGYGLGIIQLPPEASLEATMDVADQARKILAKQPEVVSGEFIGGAGFNGGSVNQGLFFFGLKPIDERTKKNQSAQAIIKGLNQDFQTIKGAKVLAQSPPAVPGFSAQGGLSFQFNDLSNGGYSFTELLQMADQLIAKAKESGDYFNLYTQFVSDAPVWRLEPDRDRMASLDVDFATAMQGLEAVYGGSFVNQTYEDGQYRQVYVQAEGDQRDVIESLGNLYVTSLTGAQIPVSELVTVKLDSAPPIVSHYNLYRTVLIQGVNALGKSSGQAIATLQSNFQEFNFNNIGMAWSALSRSEVAAGSLAALVFALGLVVVYLVLSAQYGSYIDPW